MHRHNVAWLRQWRVFRWLFDALEAVHHALAHALARVLPKGLYARALLIIIVPIVVLQSVLAFVFMERHWQQVTRQLSIATTNEIAALISIYNDYPHDDGYEKLTDIARENLGLIARVLPDQTLPEARPKPFFDLLDRTLSKQIRRRIRRPFWIDTVGNSRYVEIRILLNDAVLQVLARRNQTYASNSHIFLVWMVGTSLVLLIVAVAFLRNQIRPVLNLAEAAQRFGRGQPAPPEFKVRGAREVRLAAQSFIEMRDRIERHVEQRTTMLAGVSHDLRTVLTRFRLQLAMLGDRPEAESLGADIDEMQQMLEDYLAFAKGRCRRAAQRVRRGRAGTGGVRRRKPRRQSRGSERQTANAGGRQTQRHQAGTDESGGKCGAFCPQCRDQCAAWSGIGNDHRGRRRPRHPYREARRSIPPVLRPRRCAQPERQEHWAGPVDCAGHRARPRR